MRMPKNKTVMGPQDKYLLTIQEAAEYFGIGINRLKDMSKNLTCDFFVTVGRYKTMLIRPKFEKYIEDHRFL